ncbi:MAG: calcium-binding protein [Parvularcula sp.]
MPGPTLGTNLVGISDFSAEFPFLDFFLSSRSWVTQADGRFNTRQADLLDLDDDGWVKGFTQDGTEAPFDRIATVLFTDNQSIEPGRYILDFAGSGRIEIKAVDDILVTMEDPHRYSIDIPNGYSNSTITISILETDPDGIGDYLRDFRVFREADEAALDAGEWFLPEFLEKIQDFRVLRFMDWQETNGNTEIDWADRLTMEAARFSPGGGEAKGVPVELQVALANEVRADPWFNIPHQATDDYVRQFATYVRDHLGDGLIARFEFSNEVWNSKFDQYDWAVEKAVSDLGMPTSEIQQAARQAYGIRAAEVAKIVAEVFGDETGNRALNVFGTQSAFKGAERFALDAVDYVAAGYEAPRDAPFHVYAIAPYIGNGLGSKFLKEDVALWMTEGQAGFDHAIDFLRTGTIGQTLAKMAGVVAYHSGIAEGLGWQLEAYEGGQNIVDRIFLNGQQDQARIDFFNDLVRSPEFGTLYTEYFEVWRDNGGGLMAHFTDISQPGRYGSLGLWDSVFSGNTPRADALIDWRDNTPIYWDDDRPASTFEPQAEIPIDHGTDGNDTAKLGSGDNRYDAEAGDDSVLGGVGDDEIWGRLGSDTLRGQAGDDTLVGNEGDDRLVGGDGNDRLDGGAGQDVLVGGTGDDNIQGGAGDDIIRGDAGDDVITDLLGIANIVAARGNDWVETGDQADIISTGSGSDTIFSGSGSDHILAGSDGDLIDSGAGDDLIEAGRGADVIVAGRGDDIINVGFGDDELVFRLGDGHDRVRQFDRQGDDYIRLVGLGDDFDSYTEVMASASQVGNAVVLSFSPDQTITLERLHLIDLGPDDFLFG